MKRRILHLILPIVTLVLEILPYGAVCNFANPEGEPWKKTYSYFDLTPFGYANFAPLITAVLSCIILFLLVIYCVTGKARMAIYARNTLCVCTVFSVGPLVFGIDYFTAVSALITASLVAELLLLHFSVQNPDREA